MTSLKGKLDGMDRFDHIYQRIFKRLTFLLGMFRTDNRKLVGGLPQLSKSLS